MLIMLLVVLSGLFTQAQISYGVKLGLNISNVSGDDFDHPDKKSLMGLAIGGLLNYKINDQFSVQPELFYSQEGTRWKDSDYTERERLNYLNLPILAQYDHPSGFFAHTGPQAGFLLSAKQTDIGDGESESFDIKDDYKGFVFSWALGAGYRHTSGLGVAARYNLSLSNIIDYTDKATGKVFSIGAFYILGKNK